MNEKMKTYIDYILNSGMPLDEEESSILSVAIIQAEFAQNLNVYQCHEITVLYYMAKGFNRSAQGFDRASGFAVRE